MTLRLTQSVTVSVICETGSVSDSLTDSESASDWLSLTDLRLECESDSESE